MDDTLKSLSMDYLNLPINGQAFSDVTFSVEGRLVHAHRCILAARSLFFRKFFCGAAADKAAAAASAAPGALLMDHLSPRSPSGVSASSPRGGGSGSAVAPAPGAVIPVNSVTYEVFLLLLQFLYSGQVSLVPQKGEPRPGCGERGCWHTHCAAAVNLALDTLAAARSFGVEELALLTQKQLAGMVEKASIEDVMKVLLASRKQDLHNLWNTCSHLVAKSGLPPEVLAKHLPLDVVAKIDDLRLKSSMSRRSPFLAHHQQHQHHQGSVVEASAAELDDHHKIRRMRRALDSSDVELVKLMVMGEGLNLDEALALHYAVENCSREVVKALLELGAADVNHPAGPAGKTPLHVAAEMVCPDMVAVLLDHHADPNVRTVDGVTPLDILRTLTSDFLFKGAVPGLTHIEPNKLSLCLELVQSAAMVMSREDAAGNAAVPMYSDHHPGSGGGGVYSAAGGASTGMNLSLDNRMVYLNQGMDVMNHGDAKHLPLDVVAKIDDLRLKSSAIKAHSKAPVVTVAGQQQRFCQQCCRFHLLVEFDETKRSCRKRLEQHYRRSRKPPPDPFNSAGLFANHYADMASSGRGDGGWPSPEAMVYDNLVDLRVSAAMLQGTTKEQAKEMMAQPSSAMSVLGTSGGVGGMVASSSGTGQGPGRMRKRSGAAAFRPHCPSSLRRREKKMEVSPVSASLGAMGSLPWKLDELLATGHWALRRGAVMDEIGQLTADLHILQDLLVNLSNAQDPPMAAGYWMKEVRELSYDMEDCADQFIYADACAKIRRATRRRAITRLKINRLPKRRKWLPWITNNVLEFRTRAQEATQRYWRYNFDDCASSPGYSRVGRAAYTEPGDHVGMEGPVNELDRWLTNGEEQLKVVAIVGVAGLGKTTLALKLWSKLQEQFECRAFVRTAQKPNMRGIISSILSQVRPHQPPEPGNMHHLIRDLREHLQEKRYFIIIDDLWATSVWDVLSRAFPKGSCCSRIIITTEIMEVARACCGYCPNHIFQMEFLSDDDSQKLLLQRILLENQSPQHFDHILPHVLRKCGGLPLAIIMVASLLASRPEKLDQLGCAQNSVGSSLQLQAHPTMEGFMGQLLNISFDSLPHYLKTCLLYLSTCPEGYIFLKDDLVKQWMAEDFICAQLGEDMEEVARSYFDELVNMGLIQVMDINYNYELLSYSVHHMVLDLITYKSIEENFVTVKDYSQTAILLPDKVRRLSLHFGSATYATTPASAILSQVRSLFFFGLFNCMPSLMAFKLLRVLNLHLWGDLGNTSFDLTGIGKLFRLRYLQVTCNGTVKLPDQIGAVEHLETLEINSRVCAIPWDIVRLPSLLHLCLRGGTNLPDGIGCMRSLRTLKYFDLGDNSEDNLWGLGELTNLRDLHFTYSRLPSSEHLIALASSLGKLCNLKSVTLTSGTAGMAVLFDGSSGTSFGPVFLERLELLPPICIFSRLPKWIGQLLRICIMKVAVKELLTSDIDMLTGLPSLTVLSLCVQIAPEGRIIFKEGTFPFLKYFEFRCDVLCLAFMVGAMPNLRRLKLAFNTHISDKYSHMLAGIEHLLNLQDVTGRIVAATESDRRAAESAFKEAISKHPMCPRSSVQWVDPLEKEYRP